MVKNNMLLKISFVILMMIVLVLSICSFSYASDSFITPSLNPTIASGVSGQINTVGSNLVGIFQMVGYTIAVIMLMWIGIKYIMASPEGKAEVKKQAFPFILGSALLFLAATIVPTIQTMFQ